jgi:subtilisin family serine protease
MAAPHVTGLAALLVAHHPDFAGPFQTRNSQRVDQLFQLIKQSCTFIDVGDPSRTGAGLPNAVRALRTGAPSQPSPATATPSNPATAQFLAQLAANMQSAELSSVALAQLQGRMVATGLLRASP